MDQTMRSQIIRDTERWLETVVIGLNLCPFAADPWQQQQIKLHISEATTDSQLLTDLNTELHHLDQTDPSHTDTSLLIIPLMLHAFVDYNAFLHSVAHFMEEVGWDDQYQIASFHPRYQFADTSPQSPENLTNRSPYPMLHILREDSVSRVLTHYPHPEAIPARNIATVNALTDREKRSLFPHQYDS